jgi:DNA-binding NarL/FixJ family response regulator
MQAHRNQPAHAAPRQEARAHQHKLLFVGDGNLAKNDAIVRLFDAREVQVIEGTANLLEALRRLEADNAIDIVLLGPEFREEASSLFALKAQACGFVGLILCLMPTPRQLALSSPRSKISSGRISEGVRGEDKPRQRSMELSGNRRGVPTQLAMPPAQTMESDEPYTLEPLTTRQRIVLRRVSDGWTSKRIARSLKCSEGAVKATIHTYFESSGSGRGFCLRE